MVNARNFVRRWWGICLFAGMIAGWNEIKGMEVEAPPPDPAVRQKVEDLRSGIEMVKRFYTVVNSAPDRYRSTDAFGEIGGFIETLDTAFGKIASGDFGEGTLKKSLQDLLALILQGKRLGGAIKQDTHCTMITEPELMFAVPVFDEVTISSGDIGTYEVDGETHYWLVGDRSGQRGIERSTTGGRSPANPIDYLWPVKRVMEMFDDIVGPNGYLTWLIGYLPEERGTVAPAKVAVVQAALKGVFGETFKLRPVHGSVVDRMQKIARFVALRISHGERAGKSVSILAALHELGVSEDCFVAFIDAVDSDKKKEDGLTTSEVQKYCKAASALVKVAEAKKVPKGGVRYVPKPSTTKEPSVPIKNKLSDLKTAVEQLQRQLNAVSEKLGQLKQKRK